MTSDDASPATDEAQAADGTPTEGDRPTDARPPASTDDTASEAPAGTPPPEPGVAAGPGPDHADIAELPYEAARDELVSIVSRLEAGRTDLEESMRLWERGEALAAHCSRWLDGAQERLEHRMAQAPRGD